MKLASIKKMGIMAATFAAAGLLAFANPVKAHAEENAAPATEIEQEEVVVEPTVPDPLPDPPGETPGEEPGGTEDPGTTDQGGGTEDPGTSNPGNEDPKDPTEDPSGEQPGGEVTPPGETPTGEDPASENPSGSDPATGQEPGTESPGGTDNQNADEGSTEPENTSDSSTAEETPDQEATDTITEEPQETEPVKPEEPITEEVKTEEVKPEEMTTEEAEKEPARIELNRPEEDSKQSHVEESKPEETTTVQPKGIELEIEIISEDLSSGITHIVLRERKPSPLINFRFWTVGKTEAYALTDAFIFEEKSESSRRVGSIQLGGLVYIIQEEEDGWVYVESGTVRGFMRKDELEEKARSQTESFLTNSNLASGRFNRIRQDLLTKQKFAEELIPRYENKAYTYVKATVRDTVIAKRYALAEETEIPIWDSNNIFDDRQKVGTLNENDLLYIIEEIEGNGWVYIESGYVRGFIRTDDLISGKDIDTLVKEQGEATFGSAELTVDASKNKALYYSMVSIKSGVPGGKLRESIVDYASSFIGNPYVWGGTDLVNGADCSGFVQTIYRQYGYELPRVAENQAYAGERIPVEDAEPGDLLFYKDGTGYIHHVVMYAGDGMTVEAQSSATGIVSAAVNMNEACWAVRILDESGDSEIPEEFEGYMVGTGNCYTVTPNYHTWNWGYDCKTVFEAWKADGSMYSENVAVMDEKYLIACTNLYGVVGDWITWYFDDGSSIETIMADTKSSSDPNYTPWGHITGSIINVLEFETNELIHPGTAGCIPEIANKRVVGWTNNGNVV